MDQLLKEIWETTLLKMEKKINKGMFETLLKSAKPVTIKNSTFYISVPNEFTKNWVHSRCIPILKETIKNNFQKDYAVKIVVTPANPPIEEEIEDIKKLNNDETEVFKKEKTQIIPQNKTIKSLNPKYTFQSFVIGESNRFAHAASLAVAETPAKAYNPFFIYGGVGLGKTHLMHAIGHYVLTNNYNTNVVYLSSETFTNEFINSIRDNKTVNFRNKYRNIDVLLIDDIQFLAGKEQTQEEFFHTFNALHENNKQIIISSDRPPKEIPTLEERLRSRFEWGLITDIQPPDFETRVAILRKKARNENTEISNDVILYIAETIDSNIRELEGAFIRVIAYSSLSEKNICANLAREALKDIIQKKTKHSITVEVIQKITSDYFNITVDEIKSKKRTKMLTLPRQIAMYISRELTEESLPNIGELFGGKDHTTVLHGYKKIKNEKEEDENLKHTIDNIIKKIKND